MKRISTLVCSVLAVSSFILALHAENVTRPNDDGDNPTCTVSTYCFSGLLKVGEVSCTGSHCQRGNDYVICDDVTTKC